MITPARQLEQAIGNGQMDLVEASLQSGGLRLDEVTSRQGTLPLHLAARRGKTPMALLLIRHGAPINRLGPEGLSPLLLAIGQRHLDTAQALLEAGADPRLTDGANSFPLHFAAEIEGAQTVAKSLVGHGAQIDARNAYGLTALHVAAKSGNVDMVIWLIEAGADIQARDLEGHTPLLLAAREGQIATLTTLKSSGADPNGTNLRHEGLGDLIDPLLLEHLGRHHDLYWWIRTRLPVQRQHTVTERAMPSAASMRP